MTLTKTDIIGALSDHTGFTRRKSRHSVNTLIEIVKRTLESGENVKISQFGKFEIKERKRRRCRHPRTGAKMIVPARRVVAFKGFKGLKDTIDAQPGAVCRDDMPQAIGCAAHTHVIRPKRLKKILDDHRRWLESGGESGKKADLIGARLVQADLQGADLRWANLEGTNLTGANLRFADFKGANLKGAKLYEADLSGTNLRNSDMVGAILTGIKLDYETQLNLPKPVFDKYRQTFRVLEWSPAIVPSV